jgi:hypothetical protein
MTLTSAPTKRPPVVDSDKDDDVSLLPPDFNCDIDEDDEIDNLIEKLEVEEQVHDQVDPYLHDRARVA